MKKVSSLVNGVMVEFGGELMRMYLVLSSNWKHIVGEELEKLSSLNSLSWRGAFDLVMYVNIISSAAIIAKSFEHQILCDSNRFIKGHKINGLIFKHCSCITNDEFLSTKPMRERKLYALESNLQNQKLQIALENLHSEIQNAA